MSGSKQTEAQVIEAMKQVEAGRSTTEVGRQYGVSQHTIYAWKAKYGGMDTPISRASSLAVRPAFICFTAASLSKLSSATRRFSGMEVSEAKRLR